MNRTRRPNILLLSDQHKADEVVSMPKAFKRAGAAEFGRGPAGSADTDEPFFCHAPFYRPHQPYTPLTKYWQRHDRSRWGAGTDHGYADIETTLRNHLHEWMSRVPDAGRAEVVRARNEKEETLR